MPERLTVADKLLLASLKIRERTKTFSAEDLVVQAWKMFPDTFGLAGFADQYPDSNRVLTNLMGTKGMRGKGWLRKVGEKQYRLTSKALDDGTILLDGGGQENQNRQKYLRAQLHRETSAQLERLLNTNATRKAFGAMVGDMTFNEACGFWDITARSNANTLNTRLSEITALLERARSALENASESEGLQLPFRILSRSDLDTLMSLHEEMQLIFDPELNVIKRRTDERKGKRRRNP